MGELIDFLLISVLIYYIIRGLLRILAPVLFEKVVNKAQQQQQQQQQQQYRQTGNHQQYNRASANTGKIKVDYVPPQARKKGTIPDSEGDFVDYEEVK